MVFFYDLIYMLLHELQYYIFLFLDLFFAFFYFIIIVVVVVIYILIFCILKFKNSRIFLQNRKYTSGKISLLAIIY
jgi:hypothetical protein